MPLGGLAPCPIRAGEGWTAPNIKATTAAVAALRRTMPSAIVRYSTGTPPTVLEYHGENGTGVNAGPTVVSFGDGDNEFRFPAWQDDFGVYHNFNIKQATAKPDGVGATAATTATTEIVRANAVRVRTYHVSTGALSKLLPTTLRVYGTYVRQIGDYGGDPGKIDSVTEGKRPYAAGVLKMIESMKGSAYNKDHSGSLVFAQNVAKARLFATVFWRYPELLSNSINPARCDRRLGYWVNVLGVPVRPGDQDWQIRSRCAAKFRAAKGPTFANVRDGLEDLLGDTFVSLNLTEGADLATPPDGTFWPGVNPGPASYDLGGGTWTSPRRHFWVELVAPEESEQAQFLYDANTVMFNYLDTLLPADATFNWATSSGFIVGESLVGYDGI